ncbi:MAG: hypothetical protein V7603_5184 [Micromonosporaceae bacterium]
MPTFAELDEIRRRPQPAYPEYAALRERAKRRYPRFVEPGGPARTAALVARRGADWCTAVLGYPFPGHGRGGISVLEAHLLDLADRDGLDPPLPDPVLRWRAEDTVRRAARQREIAVAAARDVEAWRRASAGCPVPLQARANTRGRRTNSSYAPEPLRHAVPTIDAHSGSTSRPRLHQAGRALCERAGRVRPLLLLLQEEPTGQPATCVRCLAYAPKIRPAVQGAQ